MAVPVVALIVSIVLIFTMPPIGLIATPLCAIWVVVAFVMKVLGWTLGGGTSKKDR